MIDLANVKKPRPRPETPQEAPKTPKSNASKIHVESISMRPHPHEVVPEKFRKTPGVRIQSSARILAKDDKFIYLGVMQTAYQAAKATYQQLSVWSSFDIYAGMEPRFKEYRRNFMVRRSLNSLAFWATKEGYETVLEPPITEDKTPDQIKTEVALYKYVKDYVDKVNKDVNFDNVLRIAVIKSKIYGYCGFEIERDGASNPKRLIPLRSERLRALIDKNWNLKGFAYDGEGDLRSPFYTPDEVLYFVNYDLEGDWQGLSEIEPVMKETELDDKIFREDLPEALTTLWAGIALYTIDRSKMRSGVTDAEVAQAITDFINKVRPGHSIATEAVWTGQTFDIRPNLNMILAVSDKMERRIVGNFGVPRFMLGLEYQGWNRSTAYGEIEMFADGPISDIHRDFKRQVEAQWYEPLVRLKLGRVEAKYMPRIQIRNGKLRIFKAQTAALPFALKHQWKEIRTLDWLQLFDSGGRVFAQGAIDEKKFYELMGKGRSTSWDLKELEETLKEQQAVKQKRQQESPFPLVPKLTPEQLRQQAEERMSVSGTR